MSLHNRKRKSFNLFITLLNLNMVQKGNIIHNLNKKAYDGDGGIIKWCYVKKINKQN